MAVGWRDKKGSGRGRAERSPWRRLWPLLLPVVLSYLPGAGKFPYVSQAALYSDVVISHLPNLVFLKRALTSWRSVPLWSPLILSGAPFAANPLSGLWYPPGWVALIFPIPLGFNILVMAHLVWGGYGVYRLLRQEGLGESAALLAGVGFSALPKLAAHFGAGHLTLLYAVPWTPWLLWAWRAGGGPSRYRRSGVILALIFLADVRWAVYAGILGVFWHLSHSLSSKRGESRLQLDSPEDRGLWRGLGQVGAQLLLAFLVAAPLALPLLEYSRRTTRARLAAADVLAFSLPPSRLLGLLFPDFGGNPEWVLYPGGIVLGLGLLVYAWPRVRTAARFWAWLLPVSLIFSLGSALPGMEVLAALPGFSLLRVPPRALFLAGISLLILAAYGLDQIQRGLNPLETRRGGLVLAALAAFGVVLAVGVRLLAGAWVNNFLWGSLAILAAAFWILAGIHHKIPARFWIAGVLAICLLDWSVMNASLIAPRSPGRVYAEGADAAEFLAAQEGLFRTYSPSYSLPQQTSAFAGLEMADGVDPLQLQAYTGFMATATGVPVAGYSVTLPPYANGNPEQDNAAYLPDPELLGWLNVGFVVSAFEVPAEGLVLLEQKGSTRIYQNSFARPRAWIQAEPDVVGALIRPAEITAWRPNEISLQAEGPGTLVLSEIAFPGWEVWVDGLPAEPLVVSKLLRGVSVAAGVHTVVFQYKPLSVTLGLVLSLSGLLYLVGSSIFSGRKVGKPKI